MGKRGPAPKPESEKTVTVGVCMPAELAQFVETMAREQRRSKSQVALFLIEAGVDSLKQAHLHDEEGRRERDLYPHSDLTPSGKRPKAPARRRTATPAPPSSQAA